VKNTDILLIWRPVWLAPPTGHTAAAAFCGGDNFRFPFEPLLLSGIPGIAFFKFKFPQFLRLDSSFIPVRLHSADCVGFVVGSPAYLTGKCVASFLPLCYSFECNLASGYLL